MLPHCFADNIAIPLAYSYSLLLYSSARNERYSKTGDKTFPAKALSPDNSAEEGIVSGNVKHRTMQIGLLAHGTAAEIEYDSQ